MNRCIWPAQALQAQGHDVAVLHDFTYMVGMMPTVYGHHEVRFLADEVDADVVVLQRPLHRNRVELMRALQQLGVAVVVEVDDDFHSIHPLNVAWRGTSPLHDRESNRDWLAKACQEADLVTVSTPALARRYGAHGRVRVLPNYVPEGYLKLASRRVGPITVGWSGSVATHPKDLQVTQGAVAAVIAEHDARMAVVGTGKGVQAALGLRDTPTACGWLPIDRYPGALAHFDAGIVPLLESEFNEAKSWLKGLEMAAVGVPFVASSTEQYRTLAQMGAGLIATNRDAWAGQLGRLLASESLRIEYAERGRALARTMTVEAQAWQWAEAWSDARDHARSAV